MVMIGGERVQISRELELEERDRVKVQAQILAMGPAGTKVLASEEQVGGDQILGNSRMVSEIVRKNNGSDFSYLVLFKALGVRGLLYRYPKQGAIMISYVLLCP